MTNVASYWSLGSAAPLRSSGGNRALVLGRLEGTTALHVWANIHGLTPLLAAKPTMPWPDVDAPIHAHLGLCLRALAPAGSVPKGSRR
jgi:hypothetical protein